MENNWRYPLSSCSEQDTLAEIVTHAISRIEALEGKDSICLVEEYKEWLGEEVSQDVMSLRKLSNNFQQPL